MLYRNKIFTAIPSFPDYYIHKSGQVISLKQGRNSFKDQVKELSPVINNKGYYQYYMIDSKGNKKSPMGHQLLMRTFVPNPENLPHINHIDGNKLNNELSNLEWCTAKHNNQHAIDTNLRTAEYCEKEIHIYTLSGEYIKSFKSIAEASRETTCPSASIVNVAKGKLKQSKGYLFSYSLVESLTPYKGKPLTSSISVTDLRTNSTKIFSTLKEAADYIAVHRSKLLRRFKKSLDFTIENFYVVKTTM